MYKFKTKLYGMNCTKSFPSIWKIHSDAFTNWARVELLSRHIVRNEFFIANSLESFHLSDEIHSGRYGQVSSPSQHHFQCNFLAAYALPALQKLMINENKFFWLNRCFRPHDIGPHLLNCPSTLCLSYRQSPGIHLINHLFDQYLLTSGILFLIFLVHFFPVSI